MRASLPAALAIAISAASACLAATDQMNWQSGQFGAIALSAITTRTGVSTGSATLALTMTGDAQISADNSGNAELRGPDGAALVTEYDLSFDGNGSSATGRANVPYAPYSSFLNPPVRITHVPGDDEVMVTLSVRASPPSGVPLNAGSYAATASLTVSWVGP